MPEVHAKLSASGSKRWLLCPRSIELGSLFEETTSVFAEEGTLAHSLAEYVLKTYFNEEAKEPETEKEMQHYVEIYTDYVKELFFELKAKEEAFAMIEQRVDFSDIAPKGFGTCDTILFNSKTLHIVDLKYGKGVAVDAEENSQTRLYGYGALRLIRLLEESIEEVYMHIVQPRLNSISTECLSVEELETWANDYVKPRALEAYQNKGGFNPCTEACRFCPARALCKARKEKNMEILSLLGTRPDLLNKTDLQEVLMNADNIVKWIKEVQDFATSHILSGHEVEGFKLVEGRAVRSFSDTDEAFKVLIENGIEEALLYERKPLTLAKVEAQIGKKAFKDLVGDYVVTPPGKPTLVPASDKRLAMKFNTAVDDFAEDLI